MTDKEYRLIKDIAKDYGIDITHEEALVAHELVMTRTEEEDGDPEDYYYLVREYFLI